MRKQDGQLQQQKNLQDHLRWAMPYKEKETLQKFIHKDRQKKRKKKIQYKRKNERKINKIHFESCSPCGHGIASMTRRITAFSLSLKAIISALDHSSCFKASKTTDGVRSRVRSKGSKVKLLSTEYTSRPSVVVAAHWEPVK